jgi:hypothetical protein
VSGDNDHTVPSKVTRQVFKLYADNPSRTEYKEFEGRGHSLTMDSGWSVVARATLEWLDAQNLSVSHIDGDPIEAILGK